MLIATQLIRCAAPIAILLSSLAPLPVPSTVSKPTTVPAIEVIKVYGTLAGPECYGRIAPPGSSCQLSLSYLKDELGLNSDDKDLTKKQFAEKLDSLPFQWPLKPYGLSSTSFAKTATMNKGAETAMYMSELERRGLYDRRNPTGPLPTSLRPKLNFQLQHEGIDSEAADLVFRALAGGEDEKELTSAILDETFRKKGDDGNMLDYYSFIKLVGDSSIAWPSRESR